VVKQGFGEQNDLDTTEQGGAFSDVDPSFVSQRAKERGKSQLGTLGSGNHFLEIQVVDEIFDKRAAQVFGLREGGIAVMFHCGSRGLGHQVCTDYVRLMLDKQMDFGIKLPDSQLACAPFLSEEGQSYYQAMRGAANFGWANRQMIAHCIREAFQKHLGNSAHLFGVYDVAHNIGKLETHEVNGTKKSLIVHRKGATRAFGPGAPDLPQAYQAIGQPVLIPGTMGTSSYVLLGTTKSMSESFGSACHGAGRAMSRHKAKKKISGAALRQDLARQGILILCGSNRGLAEEAPFAYKDVEDVVQATHQAGLAKKVARLKPLAVIKGG